MGRAIQRAMVIGAGTMGAGIAALLADKGIATYLSDMVPGELTKSDEAAGLTEAAPDFRNRIARGALRRLQSSTPPGISPDRAPLITAGNIEDNLEWIGEVEWIVEAVVEDLRVKQTLLARIEDLRRPGTVVSSNTSGLPIRTMGAGRSDDFCRHFLGMHFFNPPRQMRLVEVIPGPSTDEDVLDAMIRFTQEVLGKGVVVGKDTPNFIANRIAAIQANVDIEHGIAGGYTVEEVDAILGVLVGRPNTAVFRLRDLVGLDVSTRVWRNLYGAIEGDIFREVLMAPHARALMEAMVDHGWLGRKTGQGFYKQVESIGGSEYWALDFETLGYRRSRPADLDTLRKARQVKDLGTRLRFLVAQKDRVGDLVWASLKHGLVYAAYCLPEIADSLVSIDRAMRWGYAWDLGPFEIWDALGVRATADRMEAEGLGIPEWVKAMLGQGCVGFYTHDEGQQASYDLFSHHYVPVPDDPTEPHASGFDDPSRDARVVPGRGRG